MALLIVFLLLFAAANVQGVFQNVEHQNDTTVYDDESVDDLRRILAQLRKDEQFPHHDRVATGTGTSVFVFNVFKLVFSMFKNVIAAINQGQVIAEIKEELKEIKENLQRVNDNLDRISSQLEDVLRSIGQNHDVTRINAIFGGDILRLKNFMRLFAYDHMYNEDNQIIVNGYSRSWAEAVLAWGDDGIDQILFNFHCMVTGCLTRPVTEVTMFGMLRPANPDIWQKMDGVFETLLEVQKMGYACWSVALDILDRSDDKKLIVQPILEERLHQQAYFYTIDERLKEWPAGSYGLVQASESCPWGTWRYGSYTHDTEDNDKTNAGSSNYNNYIKAYVNQDYVQWFFCMKYRNDGIIEWPKGSYCIFKYGVCPANFTYGYLYFDDEDANNNNKRSGTIPDGTYGRDTRYFFCCRSDGSVNTPIVLPMTTPFVLFPLHGNSCQRVSRMRATELYLFWNCEDNNNHNRRKYPYPKEYGGKDMKIYMCHYDI